VAADAARETLAASNAGRGQPASSLTSRAWWPAAKRIFGILFLCGVLALVVHHARSVDWPAVLAALRAYPARTLLGAAALAAASFAVYYTYDLIGRHVTGPALAARQVVGVAFVSYAFNLNFGSLVGGVALRYRLYARLGLGADVTTRVLVLSLLTNWLGYLFVGGLVFLLAPMDLPPDWKLGSQGLRVLGAAMLVAASVYVGMCVFATRREWQLRGHTVALPSGRVALLQLGLSSVNWMLIAGVVWTVLQDRVDYPSVLGVLLVAAVAGVIAHVPAGLGVLEGVFVALLSHRVAQPELIAALLAYRAIYYLAPLLPAIALFLLAGARERPPPAAAR
jgi:uncharacterized membrane protein YbhN (UPF0104 family)